MHLRADNLPAIRASNLDAAIARDRANRADLTDEDGIDGPWLANLERAIAADRDLRSQRSVLVQIADETFERGILCIDCQFRHTEGNGRDEPLERTCEVVDPRDCLGVEHDDRGNEP